MSRKQFSAILRTGIFSMAVALWATVNCHASGRTFAGDFRFSRNSAVVGIPQTFQLEELWCQIGHLKAEVLIMVGHAAADESNAPALSLARAAALKKMLVAKGFDPEKIYIEGKGGKGPIASNANPLGRALNRRVEFEYLQELASDKRRPNSSRDCNPVLKAIDSENVAMLKKQFDLSKRQTSTSHWTPYIQHAVRERKSASVEFYLAEAQISRLPAWERLQLVNMLIRERRADLLKRLPERDTRPTSSAGYQGFYLNVVCSRPSESADADETFSWLVTKQFPFTPEDHAALRCAVAGAYREKIDQLLKLGADINLAGNHGFPAVFSAPSDVEFFEWLRARGARFDLIAEDAWTALHSIDLKTSAALDWLLGQGLDVNARNRAGATPLLSQIHRINADLVREMIKRGADVNVRDASGETPLSVAITFQRVAAIEVILNAGAECKDKVGRQNDSLLHAALRSRVDLEKLIDLFESCGVDVLSVNGDGDTALHVAARFATSAAVRVVSKYDALLNVRNFAGDTPLHVAAGRNVLVYPPYISSGPRLAPMLSRNLVSEKRAIVEVLLARGSRKEIRDAVGRLPMQRITSAEGQEEIIDLLRPIAVSP